MTPKFALEHIAWEILRLNTISDEERELLLNTLPYVYVYPVVHDQLYGGPEEGGWWYNTQTVIRSRIGEEDRYGYHGHPRHMIMRLDKALRACRRLNDLTDELVNRGRYEDQHVGYEWSLGYPEDTPEHRPYYC